MWNILVVGGGGVTPFIMEYSVYPEAPPRRHIFLTGLSFKNWWGFRLFRCVKSPIILKRSNRCILWV